MKLLIFFTFFLLANYGCNQAPFEDKEMIGFWTLEGEGKLRSFYLIKIEPNGAFTECLLDSTSNEIHKTKATGVWSVKDSTFSLSRLTNEKGNEETNPTSLKFRIRNSNQSINLYFIYDTKNKVPNTATIIMKKKMDY